VKKEPLSAAISLQYRLVKAAFAAAFAAQAYAKPPER
jgi:hypothetical protein